jgi:hypothetical protein
MSPDGFFRGGKIRVFELPLLRNAQKTPFKKIDKTIKIKMKMK